MLGRRSVFGVMFGVMFAALFAGPVAAQSPGAPLKDPGVATILGLVLPGGGQYYSEVTGKGFGITALTAFAVWFGASHSHGDEYSARLVDVPPTLSNPLGLEWQTYLARPPNRSPLVLGIAAGGAVWLYGALTAASDARRTNEQRLRVSVTPRGAGVTLVF